MEFRYPTAVTELINKSRTYLTKNLTDKEAGGLEFETLIKELGPPIDCYPDWHPILTLPADGMVMDNSLSQIRAYEGIDHTVSFMKGFVTCPYSENAAQKLVSNINGTHGISAYRLDTPLYSDNSFPVVVQASPVELEGDGTIRNRDAVLWCTALLVESAKTSSVGETWWSIKDNLLGTPNGARSSIFVNQYTGSHIRKILEVLNNSGVFGPVKEWSLGMLSEPKRKRISENLIRTAVQGWDKESASFTFGYRDENCRAEIRDTWKDGAELSVRVTIGESDLVVTGFYYQDGRISPTFDPKGKRAIAEKFL